MLRALVAGFTAAVALTPRAADAYFCTRAVCDPRDASCTEPRPSQAWAQRCIPFYVSSEGSMLDGTEGEQLVIQSFGVWSGEDCTDLEFVYRGRTTEAEAWDPNNPGENKNVIASIESSHPDFDADPRLLALTLTRYAVATGEIFDADIIINKAGHTFDDVADVVACRNQDRAFDLRSVLVHEIGHFIGFDHTTVAGATMIASADVCEIDKRDLGVDDQMAVCTVYPKGGETRTCTPPATYNPSGLDPTPFRDQCGRALLPVDPGGCSCGTNAAETSALAIVVLMGAVAIRRRRAIR